MKPYVSDERLYELGKRLTEMLGEYFIQIHRGPWNVPASSDNPEIEVTVEVKYECPKTIGGKTLKEILEEARSEFSDVYIWDFIGVEPTDDSVVGDANWLHQPSDIEW